MLICLRDIQASFCKPKRRPPLAPVRQSKQKSPMEALTRSLLVDGIFEFTGALSAHVVVRISRCLSAVIHSCGRVTCRLPSRRTLCILPCFAVLMDFLASEAATGSICVFTRCLTKKSSFVLIL